MRRLRPSERVTIGVWLVAAAVAGCAPAPSRPPPRTPAPARSYFPLTRGSWWTYRVQDFPMRWNFERKVSVTRHARISGRDHRAAILEEVISTGNDPVFQAPVQPMAYFWERGYLRGLYVMGQGKDFEPIDGFSELRVLPEALGAEATWVAGDPGPARTRELQLTIEQRHRAVLEERTVRVAAGSFSRCIRVDTVATQRAVLDTIPGDDLVFYYSDWYAPEVGLIRSAMWDDPEREHARVWIELADFEIAPPPSPRR